MEKKFYITIEAYTTCIIEFYMSSKKIFRSPDIAYSVTAKLIRKETHEQSICQSDICKSTIQKGFKISCKLLHTFKRTL